MCAFLDIFELYEFFLKVLKKYGRDAIIMTNILSEMNDMNINCEKLPLKIDAGLWNNGHIQGIAVDPINEFIYYSFTTLLVKAKFDGTIVGSVKGLVGHLGCIDFNDEDGKVYGSLELKHDSIGQGIMRTTGIKIADEDAFYIAVFEVDKINAMDMDAEKDGVMRAVYIPQVAEWYAYVDEKNGIQHKFACSGIDGTAIGPVFGEGKESPTMLMVACGIYGDNNRQDNDNNIIMQFDWREFDKIAQPLTQLEPHHIGVNPDKTYFLFTGNTTWGIQNLEYDAYDNSWIVAVYNGKKPEYPNFPTYIIDGDVKPIENYVQYGEKGLNLTLKKTGIRHEATGIWGNNFEKGETGIYAFGNGYYYVSYNFKTPEKLNGSVIKLCKRSGNEEIPFETFLKD